MKFKFSKHAEFDNVSLIWEHSIQDWAELRESRNLRAQFSNDLAQAIADYSLKPPVTLVMICSDIPKPFDRRNIILHQSDLKGDSIYFPLRGK